MKLPFISGSSFRESTSRLFCEKHSVVCVKSLFPEQVSICREPRTNSLPPRRHVLHVVSLRLQFRFLSLRIYFFLSWPQSAAVLLLLFLKERERRRETGLKKKNPPLKKQRWKSEPLWAKCSFRSGMTQAAAVISTVIVGHHQRASITPARSWQRQQVPPLPASLAPPTPPPPLCEKTKKKKPSDIQKGTDLR